MKSGMMMYLLSQPEEEYGGAESRQYQENRRQPNQYTRNEMNGDWPQDNEMRRRRDSRGRYMEGGEGMPQDSEMRRRRGSDGRYMEGEVGMAEDARAYEARNEYQPRRSEYGRAESRYMPQYPIIQEPRGGLYDGGGGIGFGTRDRQYETRSHYGGHGDENGSQRQTARVGGTMWMEPEEEGMEMDRATAERWVRGMRGEDPARAQGGRWTAEELKSMAQKMGIDPNSEEFYEFYAMTNAMYSDYSEVAKKFNITSPEYYGMLAKAWMHDKDAVPGKTALYYRYCVRKNAV